MPFIEQLIETTILVLTWVSLWNIYDHYVQRGNRTAEQRLEIYFFTFLLGCLLMYFYYEK